MKKIKNGFTLAEILITLVIIGVIAAITMPTLKANIDKNLWANGLKTSVSILNNGFAQMKAQESVDDMRDTTLWIDHVKNNIEASSSEDLQEDVKKELDKVFKIEKMSEGIPSKISIYTLSGTKNNDMAGYIRFYLGNSTTLNIKFLQPTYGGKCTKDFCYPVADIFVDTNGDKKPNTYGKDIHRFYLGEDGHLYAYGSEAVNEYKPSIPKWNSSNGCQGKNPKTDGISCTARVIEESYEITYQ